MKEKDYAVMRVSRKRLSKNCISRSRASRNLTEVASFTATGDSEAKKDFKQWFPSGDGYIRYKLYRLIDTAAGK